jgi:hypothetical protein
MSGFVGAMTLIGAVIFPFVMMPLLWRRMKRVRDQSYAERTPQRHTAMWEETVDTRDGLTIGHSHDPNDDLIALGEKARHAPWPLINQ